MRAIWIVIFVMCAGCVRPSRMKLKGRFSGLAQLKLMLPRLAALPAPPPPPPGAPEPPPVTEAPEPRPRHRPRERPVPPPPASEPPPRAGRTVHARFQSQGKWLCEPHATFEACTESCSARFRIALKMGASTECACSTEGRCDQMIDH